MEYCNRIRDASQLTAPNDLEVGRVDRAISAVLCLVFLLVFVRYSRWAWRARGTRGCALNCVLAAASFYLLLSLPALWVRTTIAWRAHVAVDSASRSCRENTLKCTELCGMVVAMNKRLKANPPPHPTVIQALGASLAAAFVLLTAILSLLCYFNLLSTPQLEDTESSETSSVRASRKSDRFMLRILDPPTTLNDSNDDDCCVVCLGELWDARVCELACGHRFHLRCISKWLAKSHRPLCPLCQCDVRKEERHDVP